MYDLFVHYNWVDTRWQ